MKLLIIAAILSVSLVDAYENQTSFGSPKAKCVKSFGGSCYKDAVTVDFEPPTYAVGDINGQDGWKKTGAFDVKVVAQNTYKTFGKQSLRISDAVTSGSFGDQAIAKPLTNSVGETVSTAGTFTTGTKYRNLEVKFDIATTTTSVQTGLHMTVSPDRGDGSRMSFLRFTDSTKGIVVIFDDVQGILPVGDPSCSAGPCANFVESIIGTLKRGVAHTIRLSLYTREGPSNDVVKVYIDGKLVHTGTSWEDYYRYDVESSAEMTPRIVKTVLFRESGSANPGHNGAGFLIDNLVIGAY